MRDDTAHTARSGRGRDGCGLPAIMLVEAVVVIDEERRRLLLLLLAALLVVCTGWWEGGCCWGVVAGFGCWEREADRATGR